MDFTTVIGVDMKTLEFLKCVWPTWRKHKPSLIRRPFIIFHNYVTQAAIQDVIGSGVDVSYIHWPPHAVAYPRDGLSKWSNPQRAKMLAGFVHVPNLVKTPYWLKLDLDVVADGQDDWVRPEWFTDSPAIIAPAWNYTKPPEQMLLLDEWVANKKPAGLSETLPLNLRPEPGAKAVYHKRICSWCAFFNTEFSIRISQWANSTCGIGQIPVDSQDGYAWYCAARSGALIYTYPMKRCGWRLRNNLESVREESQKVLA